MKQLHFKHSPFQDLASMLLAMLITNQLKTFCPLVNMHLYQPNLDYFFSNHCRISHDQSCQLYLVVCCWQINIRYLRLEELPFRSYKLFATGRADSYMEPGIQKIKNHLQVPGFTKTPCLITPSDLELILKKLGTNCYFPWAANKGYNIHQKHFLPISEAKKLFSFFLREDTEGRNEKNW